MKLQATRRRVFASALAAAMLLAGGLTATTSAACSGAIVVRSLQQAYWTCGPNQDGYLMTGDLDGCWWITEFTPTPESKTGKSHYRATGAEHFSGCVRMGLDI